MLTRSEITDWALFVGAIGATVFSWGMGNYHRVREMQRDEETADRRRRREEDRNDRQQILEDIRSQARVLAEMESRQQSLQRELETLTLKIEETKCRLPNDDGDNECHSR